MTWEEKRVKCIACLLLERPHPAINIFPNWFVCCLLPTTSTIISQCADDSCIIYHLLACWMFSFIKANPATPSWLALQRPRIGSCVFGFSPVVGMRGASHPVAFASVPGCDVAANNHCLDGTRTTIIWELYGRHEWLRPVGQQDLSVPFPRRKRNDSILELKQDMNNDKMPQG